MNSIRDGKLYVNLERRIILMLDSFLTDSQVEDFMEEEYEEV